MAPFYIAAADRRLYSSFDVAQHIPAALADCGAQHIHGGRSGKGEDGLKIVPVKMSFRLKAAAFKDSIGDADCGGTFELELLSGFIIIHQERTVNDVENVAAVVIPVGIHQFAANVRDLLAKVFVMDTVLSGKHFRHRLNQIGAELPYFWVTRITAYSSVAHIENIVQTRNTAGLV
ncbi:hypothetical protein ACKXF6_12170 [Faecalibacterium taiwanense]|uniref:hypothetical protein n=1 Tax=Faecalibacterium taiwanense TaxID=3030638 RepID=UPI003AAC7FA0